MVEITGNRDKGRGITVKDIPLDQKEGPPMKEYKIKGLDETTLSIQAADGYIGIREGEEYKFYASINKHRQLKFNVINESHGQKSKNIFPRQLIELVIRKWQSRFDSVLAEWYPESINIAAFNEALEKGLSEEEAAKVTWTGQILTGLGFDQVQEVKRVDDEIFAEFKKSE